MKNIILIILIVCSLNAEDKVANKPTELEMFLFKIGFTSLVNDFEKEKEIRTLNTDDIKQLKENIEFILQKLNKDNLEKVVTTKAISSQNEIKLLEEIQTLRDELNLLKNEVKNQIPVGDLGIPKEEIQKENQKTEAKEIQNKEVKQQKVKTIKAKVIPKKVPKKVVKKVPKKVVEKVLKKVVKSSDSKRVVTQREANTLKPILVRVQKVKTKIGPFKTTRDVNTLYYGDTVKIEFCNKYGWCKIKGKNEYIAKYSLVAF